MAALHKYRFGALLAIFTLVFSVVAVDYAEARRGGSFGSRGARTFQSAPATNTAPSAAPVQRSITPGTAAQPNAGRAATGAAAGAAANRGLFGSPLMRGLMLGGLFGLLMGAGFGGLGGFMALLVQIALIAGVIWLAMRLFRSRPQTATAGNQRQRGNAMNYERQDPAAGGGRDFRHLGAGLGGGAATGAASASAPERSGNPDELGITPDDLGIFEQRLYQLQDAFGREDYAAIREITTPEIMSYLSEELSQNATRGVKSEVRDVKLLQGDIAESWKEGSREFATVAMRYSMIQVLRDRQSGNIVEGSDSEPVESTEVWTFLRDHHDEWKLTAIQEA
ncbi:Tim44 domain-containing protein [Aureimonas altamirensis]|uniref:TIM44-like domain-containing protein n=1 Tax=Aureimonas altamirensis TaxID=370622 RepID=UPI002037685C|nr:Tim44 domain-containing protein [Aureimonas altamirensis]MCM2503700.1 Tim44 domain-containing protein [Aureimonas altamirensis]